MDSTYAIKRRKLNGSAAHAVNRPFVSPLKKAQNISTRTTTDETPTSKLSSRPISSSHIQSGTPANKGQQALSSDDVVLQKSCTALEHQIKAIRNEIEMLKQARRVSEAGSDDKLRRLTQTWRSASQQAADVLFETAKERVSAMGGVSAMKKSEREQAQRSSYGFDDQDEKVRQVDSDGEELSENETARRKAEIMEAQYSSAGKGELNDEEQSFTMEMMLQSMNIDPDLIGYDKKNEEWQS